MPDPKRVGRVFYVTGINQDESLAFITHDGENNTCYSDTESNSSGYSSSSSFKYSGEEKRILTHDQKVLQMWQRLNPHSPVLKRSTPKESRAVRRVNSSTKNLLTVRKTLEKSRVSQHTDSKTNTTNTDNDSCWDIDLPERSDMPNKTSERPRSEPLNTSHEAGLAISTIRRSLDGDKRKTCNVTSNDWRRRPNISEYNCLPQYRVKVGSDTEEALTTAKPLTEHCTDVYDEGFLVDESLTEFISSVDKDKLAGILQFYDHVTTESAYRQKQRYESVYF